MSYVPRVLAEDEIVVDTASFHWLYLFIGTLPLLVVLGLMVAADNLPALAQILALDPKDLEAVGLDPNRIAVNETVDIVFYILLAAASLLFLQRVIDILTTEMVVTDRRVILKKGLISRNVSEIKLDRVESVELDQSVLGRIFNFGRVVVHGTGVGAITFPSMLAWPLQFRGAIEDRRRAKKVEVTESGPPSEPIETALIEELRTEINALKDDIAAVKADNKDLQAQNTKLEEQLRALLGMENDALREENEQLKRLIDVAGPVSKSSEPGGKEDPEGK